jgi:hypothetical protein
MLLVFDSRPDYAYNLSMDAPDRRFYAMKELFLIPRPQKLEKPRGF